MCLSSCILEYLWGKVGTDPGLLDDNGSGDALNSLIILMTKLKWLSHFILSGFLSLASFRRFSSGSLPSSLLSVPRFIGNMNQMIPTVLFFSCMIGLASTMGEMGYLLGLAMELKRFGVFLIGAYSVYHIG